MLLGDCPDGLSQSVEEPCAVGKGAGHRAHEQVVVLVLQHQALLRPEISIDGRRGDVGAVGDLLDRHVVVPVC